MRYKYTVQYNFYFDIKLLITESLKPQKPNSLQIKLQKRVDIHPNILKFCGVTKLEGEN